MSSDIEISQTSSSTDFPGVIILNEQQFNCMIRQIEPQFDAMSLPARVECSICLQSQYSSLESERHRCIICSQDTQFQLGLEGVCLVIYQQEQQLPPVLLWYQYVISQQPHQNLSNAESELNVDNRPIIGLDQVIPYS